jgi:uncharacterized membrane protein (DUF4010 family)
VLAGIINVGILPRLLPVVGAMAVVGGLAALWLARGRGEEAAVAGGHLTNPFSLKAALSFGLFYAVILLAVRAAQVYFGDGGAYAAAAVSGIAEVDAATIAFSRLGPMADAWRTPASAVTLAALVNTFVKMGLAIGVGGGRFRAYVAVALGLMVLVGAATGAWVYLRF